MLLSDVVLLTYNDVVSLQSCDVLFFEVFSLKCGKQSVSVRLHQPVVQMWWSVAVVVMSGLDHQ